MKTIFAGWMTVVLIGAGCVSSENAPPGQGGAPASPGLARKFSGATPLVWSQRLADSEIARKGDSLKWTADGKAKWDYAAGLFELSLLDLTEATSDPHYEKYSRAAIDSFLQPDGGIHTFNRNEFQLDSMNSGKVVLALWARTHSDRYMMAARTLREQLFFQPRTPGGGFWHKMRYPNQMWLDGVYMASPFFAQYAELFNERSDFADVARQFQMIDEHTYDATSGLNYHGWDSAKVQPWANPETGCSSNFWGRAEGWYAMALVDALDFFPTDHPARQRLIANFQKTAQGIVKWQDPRSGLWWQVLDQGGRKGNYEEATASAMFVYALAKGVNRGYLSADLKPAIEKGYAGIVQNLIKPDGDQRWSLTQCCSVAGLGGAPTGGKMRDGSYEYYIGEPVVSDDLKGIGPLILAGIEMQTLTRTNIQ